MREKCECHKTSIILLWLLGSLEARKKDLGIPSQQRQLALRVHGTDLTTTKDNVMNYADNEDESIVRCKTSTMECTTDPTTVCLIQYSLSLETGNGEYVTE